METLSNFKFPPLTTIDSIVFAAFVLFSILLSLSLMSYKAGFKQADVDVLFATPVSPKVVMGFRLVRDYLLTMLLPIIIGIFALNSVITLIAQILSKEPQTAGILLKTIGLAWVLSAVCWVSLGYATSLFVGRSDTDSDRNARIIGWSIAGAIISTLTYAVLAFRANPTFETLQAIAQSPIIRIVYFIPSAATALVMAPLTKAWVPGILGGVALVGLIAGGVWAALSQVGWLYDQASVKGFKNAGMRELQKKGDTSGMMAEYARMGKIKKGRLASWISKKTFSGASAIIYKELILFFRTQITSTIIFALVICWVGPLFLFILHGPGTERIAGPMYLGMTCAMLFFIGLTSSQSNYLETLRRVDLTKPLPFSPAVTVFYEVIAKAMPPMLVSLAPFFIGFVMRPELWDLHLTGILLAPSFMLLMASFSFLVIVLFPDVDDPTQRGFRGMILMLGALMVAIPSAGLLIGAFLLNLPKSPVALVAGGINLGLSVLLAWIAGGIYADFNPSE